MNSLKFLVSISAYFWDNYQGGSGVFIDQELLVEIDLDFEACENSDTVKNKIKAQVEHHLFKVRSFDQTIYSKKQGEYNIKRIVLL